MTRPTMFDQYGRCIHCGFWHDDLDSDMAQVCGAHETRGCACALNRQFFPLPTPRRTAAGLYVVPGHPEYETATEVYEKRLAIADKNAADFERGMNWVLGVGFAIVGLIAIWRLCA